MQNQQRFKLVHNLPRAHHVCGSRIPGHWIQAPPPADSVWASYLKSPETDNKCLMEESKAIFKAGQKRKKLSQQQGQ
jgi:hypothetical protein